MGGYDVCKGTCDKYKIIGSPPKGGRYNAGQKRCTMCSLYVHWDGNFCPCCSYMLRSKPRNPKLRVMIRI